MKTIIILIGIVMILIVLNGCNNMIKKLDVGEIKVPLKTEKQVAIEELNETLNRIGLTDCLNEDGTLKDYCRDIIYNEGKGLFSIV